MITFYELKELVCRMFGNRQDEIDDNDVVFTLRPMPHYAEWNGDFVLKNDELKDIYETINSAQMQGLELYVNHQYEVAVELDRSTIRMMEFPQSSVDRENNIEYQIGSCSVEYCVFLLMMLVEKSKQEKRRVVLPAKFRRGYPYHIRNDDTNREIDWKQILIGMMREYSIKINSGDYSSLDKMREKKEAFVFEFIYKTEQAIGEYVELEEILPRLEMKRRNIDSLSDCLETIPKQEYISDVVDYYRLAFSSVDPYIKYISFYHVMEYFYDEVFKRNIVTDLTDKITHPDFSYKDQEKVYEIATFVKNRMHMNNESGQGNELESLKYVLKEYVHIEQLKSKINAIDSEALLFYQNNKVTFCKAPTIPWKDVENVYNHIAKRIYYTRNSLIHSKSGKNTERYKPYKDEKALQKEIPLVRTIAEMIIINSSKIV